MALVSARRIELAAVVTFRRLPLNGLGEIVLTEVTSSARAPHHDIGFTLPGHAVEREHGDDAGFGHFDQRFDGILRAPELFRGRPRPGVEFHRRVGVLDVLPLMLRHLTPWVRPPALEGI